jgi:BirA family biotin operon repressor/biotin-[acetyl-CoA-carboxylase] ligase
MKLPLAQHLVAQLEILPTAGSTNDELVAAAPSLDDFAVIVTDDQTSGRGRLGREWVAPAGKCLAISVLLRPTLPAGEPLALEHFGWLPLIAGVAMAKAVQTQVSGSVGLKWPNDVQIDGNKVSGLLAELLSGGAERRGDAVVLGAGVNLSLTRDELPTPVATSLVLNGATLEGDELADAVLTAYLENLRGLYDDFVGLGADVVASGTRDLVTEYCTTLGQEVRVQLPGADDIVGVATGIDLAGRLQVRRSSDGVVVTVAAGDVTHLRYE